MRVQSHTQTLVCVLFSHPLSMDRLFASVIQSLPRELHEALAEAELLDSRVLDAYPRSSAEELGLLNASHHPARIRMTRKGVGLQSVGVALSSSLDLDLGTSSLTAGVDLLVDESVCTATPTLVDSSSVCRSVEPVSLDRAVNVKVGALEVAEKSCFPDVSCHSEFRVEKYSKVGCSKTARQCQPVSSTDGRSSKNCSPGSARVIERWWKFKKCSPVSARVFDRWRYFKKMLAIVSPFLPEVRTGPKCLLEELIKSRWTRLRSLLSRLQLRTLHRQMLQLF